MSGFTGLAAKLLVGWLPLLVAGVRHRRQGKPDARLLMIAGVLWGLAAAVGYWFLATMPVPSPS